MRAGTAVVIGLVVFVMALAGWEFYWRACGSEPAIRNSPGLWAMQRRRIDNGEGHKTVIVGSSRMLFDVQLPSGSSSAASGRSSWRSKARHRFR